MKLKLLNLNLFQGGKFMDRILDFVHQEKPDIMAFQEVYDNDLSLKTLKQELSDYHFQFSPELTHIYPDKEVEEGDAVFSRFPLKFINQKFFYPYQKIRHDPNRKDFIYYPSSLQHIFIDELSLHVINLHGIWGLDGLDNERRLKMSKIIVNEIKDLDKIIVTGDFNVKPNTQTIANIEKHLTNVLKDELITTFNMKRKTNPGYAKAAVDMIFVSPTIKILSKSCPHVDISDHLPLLCSLEI